MLDSARSVVRERLLIHPAFADPTQPYLSLPTLKAYLAERGWHTTVMDLNLEAVRHLLAPAALEDLTNRAREQLARLNAAARLTFSEQLQYRELAEALEQCERLLGAPGPVAALADADDFYQWDRYQAARRQVDIAFRLLGGVHFPYRFGFNEAAHRFLPWGFATLRTYCESGRSPLREFYAQRFRPTFDDLEDVDGAVDLSRVDFVGLSVVFPSQIPEAFHLARFLRTAAPQAFLAMGGPCLHQAVVHMDEARRSQLFDYVDGVGLYEGEETLTELFERLPQWTGADPAVRSQVLAEVPNLLYRDAATGTLAQGPTRAFDVRTSPLPDYSDLDLDAYLAPSRTLLYAPTRGCYWGRCSFCYYGLTERGTARYREVPPDVAASHLARLARRHGVRNFYISCDVLSPSYAVRFAQAIVDRKLKIHWSSDFKLDDYFTPQRCELLFKSGLRSAAFGMESGSNRILELMDKGADRSVLTDVSRRFQRAGVATEWMTFTGHPTESLAEALDTVHWIEEQRDDVSLFIVGEFGLQPGSLVAQEPDRFGVAEVMFSEADDFRLYARFRTRDAALRPEELRELEDHIDRLADRYRLASYPWAGAISTHHTFLYFLRGGANVFRQLAERASPKTDGSREPGRHLARSDGVRLRFSLSGIDRALRTFEERYLRELRNPWEAGRRRGGVAGAWALSQDPLVRADAELPQLEPKG
ncbi:MAG: radical SAM protein [Planctomycetota bacterium]